MRRQQIKVAKRIVSMTLANLLVLYSLPPAVEPPRVFTGAQNPHSDDLMALRQAAQQLNFNALSAELYHQWWHVQQNFTAAIDGLVRFCSTSVASADSNTPFYIHKVPATSPFIFDEYPGNPPRTSLFPPLGVPENINGQYQYQEPNFLGIGTHAVSTPWPEQLSGLSTTLPILDKNQQNPQPVEVYNSFFSEHDGATGRGLFVAHFYEDGQTAYPRALMESVQGASSGRSYRDIVLEHPGTSVLNGYGPNWRNWYSRDEIAGGLGQFGEPKLELDGVNFALKQNPYARFGYQDWQTAKDHNPWAAQTKERSIYYWETDPYVVSKLNEKIRNNPGAFDKAPQPEVKGFWVELQHFKAGAFNGDGWEENADGSLRFADYPIYDGKFTIPLPFPYPGAKNNPNAAKKYSKLTFYRPFWEDKAAGAFRGFLNAADAMTNQGDHGTLADFVCVGAFADYEPEFADDPKNDGEIAKAIRLAYLESLNAQAPSPGPSATPSDGSVPTPLPSSNRGDHPNPAEFWEAINKEYGDVIPQLPPGIWDRAGLMLQYPGDDCSRALGFLNTFKTNQQFITQLFPDEQLKLCNYLLDGGNHAILANAFLEACNRDGLAKAVHDFSFLMTTDPTQQLGEPNVAQRPFATENLDLRGDPVNIVEGGQYHDHYDMMVPGRGMRTDFLRTYNSTYQSDFSARDIRPMGYGWTHTYNQFLHRFPDDGIAYYDEHGKSTIFMPSGTGFVAPAFSPLKLTQLPDGRYQIHQPGGTVLTFSGGLKRIATFEKLFYRDNIEEFGNKQPIDAGRLQTIRDRNGNQFTLTYANGNLTQVTDPGGRSLRFEYSGNRLIKMTDMASRVFTYRYENDNLVEVVHPGDRHQVYTYSGHLMTGHSDLDPNQTWQFGYDGAGKVTQVTDPEGNRTDYAYQAGHVTETTHEVDGRAFQTQFDIANHNITRMTDPTGAVHTYDYDDRHHRTKDTFNRGDRTIVTSYQYDDDGNMVRFVDGSGQATEIKYGANAQPSEVKNPAGVTVIRLDAHGNMVGATDPAGRSVGFTVDDQGQVQAVTDPGQHRTGLEHNSHGQLVHVDNPLGGWTTYEYNALGQVTATTDPNGTRRYEYDNKNQLHAYTDQLGRRTVLDADANGNVTHVTDPGGRATQLSYNRKNQLVLVRDNAGGETRYAYTAQGRLWRVIDPNGRVTMLERDGNGRVTRIVYPNQTAKTFKYDAAGNVTEAANELAEATRYAYDALNRVATLTDPAGQATSVEYNWLGAVTRVTNPLQQTTRFGMNAVGQLTDVIPPGPQGATHYHYNADGTLASIERPKNQVVSYTYNAANQVLTMTDPLKTVRYEYDNLGRLMGISAPRGRGVDFRRDAIGRLTSVVDALGNPTEYDYWASGELKTVRKVNGAVTQYEYDAVGRPARVSAPEGRVSQFSYDKAGNLLEQTSPTGAVTDYTYDVLNRLMAINDLTKGAKTSYLYDPAGRMTSVTDPDGQTTTLQYDRLGRPAQVNAPLNARTSFEYDALGNLLRQVDANGHATRYAYNDNNRMVSVTDALNHQTTYDYDPLGNMTTIRRLADGATTSIAYNNLNLPEDVVDPLSHHTRLQYDEFGNRTAMIDAKNRTTRFEYDALNRLTTSFEPLGRTTRYGYDRVGNLEQVTNAIGASTRLVYDTADRLRFAYEPLGRTTEYRYNPLDQVTLVRDANGNQNSVDYDRSGRPVREMNGLGYATDYFYDRLDRLVRKTDALGHNTQYHYDELSRLVGVTDAIGNQTRYRYDPVGNLKNLIDARGRQWGFDYDALDRRVLERDPLGRTSQFTFMPEGTLGQKRDGNGRVISYGYDRLDRLTSLRTAEDYQSFAYDEVGNMTSYQNRANRTINRYDDLDQLVEETNMNWGKTTRYAYDPIGRVTQLTTPMGRSVRYGYDELDQLRTLSDPEGNRTAYQYDRGGRLTRTDYGNGNHSLYAYDQADQTRSIVHQGRSGQILQGYYYDYDRLGNRTQVQETDGSYTHYSYDPLNRLQEVAYPIATILAERKGFLPDTASNSKTIAAQPAVQTTNTSSQGSSGLPAFKSASSNLGKTMRKVLSVTDLGGTTSGTQTDTSTGSNNGYTGDPDKDKNTDANGNGWANGHQSPTPAPTSTPAPTAAPSSAPTVVPTAAPIPKPQSNPGGWEYYTPYIPYWERSPSPVPSVAPMPTPQPTHAAPAAVAAPGNGNGPTKQQLPPGKQGNWGAHNQPYWGDPVASVRYSYDEVGNRTSEVSERGTTQYTYDEANQLNRKVFYANNPLPAVGNPSHPHYMDETTYDYDQNGNRTAETTNKAGESKQLATTRYQYDTLNQLTGIDYPEGRKASYAYDPMGRLIEWQRPHLPGERPVQAETSRFSYSGHSVIAEWDQSNSPMAEFYHGNGQVVAKRLFGQASDFNQYGVINPHENYLYFQHDALGSVTGMSDSTGSAVMRYRQDAFGTPLAGILEPHNTQLLTEKRFDTQSGLYYFGSRWYDPGSGRFMNQDSYRGALAEPMSLHRYAYVHNNPGNMVDEWGYSAQWKPQPRQKSLLESMDAALEGPSEAIDSYLRGIEEPLNNVLNRIGLTNIFVSGSGSFGSSNQVGQYSSPQTTLGNGSVGATIGGDGRVSAGVIGSSGHVEGAISLANNSQNAPKAPTSEDIAITTAVDDLNRGSTEVAMGTLKAAIAKANPSPEGMEASLVDRNGMLDVGYGQGANPITGKRNTTPLTLGQGMIVAGVTVVIVAGGIAIGTGAAATLTTLTIADWESGAAMVYLTNRYGAVIAERLRQAIEGAKMFASDMVGGVRPQARPGAIFPKPQQIHHFLTDKHMTKFTPLFKKIVDKYGLDLDGAWNKMPMPHAGRHAEAYHEFMLDRLRQIDMIAKGNRERFLKLFEQLKQEVIDNPDMLYKDYWKK